MPIVLAQDGAISETTGDRVSALVGVYSQKGHAYLAIAILEKVDGIEAIQKDFEGSDKAKAKLASEKLRKHSLDSINLPDGKSVTYSRLCTSIRKAGGRICLFRDDERAYTLWDMPTNTMPNASVKGGKLWWNKPERLITEDE